MRGNTCVLIILTQIIAAKVPKLLSFVASPINRISNCTLNLVYRYEIKFFLFGDNLQDVQKIAFAKQDGPSGTPCEDDKHTGVLKFTLISNRSINILHLATDYGIIGNTYFCFKHQAEDGTLLWTHQPTLFPKAFLLESELFYFDIVTAWVLFAILLCCSALFSGLNLGIMTLDIMSLEILINAGSVKEKKMASDVLPIRRRGNLILCSLTMANVVVNVVISMLSDKLIGGTGLAILYASCGILVFGEIAPQALCNRYSLFIAYKTITFTKVVIYLTFPIAFPVSFLLDKLLGEDMGRTLNKATLAELIKQHESLGFVKKEEFNIITGALNMDQRNAKSIMTHIDNVFMLPHNSILDFETTNEIISHGYTRIPIFKDDRRQIISVLNVKDLAFVDPKDKLPVSTICKFYNRPFIFIAASETLRTLFEKFRKGSTHLGIIYEENKESPDIDIEYRTVIGIVTMEDVIEEILQEEIVDETDIIMDNVSRRKRSLRFPNMDLWPLFNNREGSKISSQLKIAALRYLVANTPYFSQDCVNSAILQGFLNSSFAVLHEYNPVVPESNIIYKMNEVANTAMLTLQGTLLVSIHDGKMQFEAGAFMMFGDEIFTKINEQFLQLPEEWNLDALLKSLSEKASFLPDYTATVSTDVRCLEWTAETYLVLRYLTQALAKYSESPHLNQMVDLFERFWRVRHHNGISISCSTSGIRILEPDYRSPIPDIPIIHSQTPAAMSDSREHPETERDQEASPSPLQPTNGSDPTSRGSDDHQQTRDGTDTPKYKSVKRRER